MGRTKEQARVYNRAWYKKNREKAHARRRAWRKKNREKASAYDRTWYKKNREKICAVARASYKKNLEKMRARKRASYHKNPACRYGLSIQEYQTLLAFQGGACAICKQPQPQRARRKRLSLDHCHKTGTIRKLLCSHCNSGIGFFKDDPELCRAAANYLDGFSLA